MKQVVLFVLILLTAISLNAQFFYVSGIINDKQSDEPIPFATILSKKTGRGVLSDSTGFFQLSFWEPSINDTLEIRSVGYKTLLIPVNINQFKLELSLKLELLPANNEVVVKSKYNRALWFWRQIQKHKKENNRSKFNSYSYEVYNKLELDINNVNKEKLGKNKLIKPFDFILENIDSISEEKPFLPVFITETISDYYFQKSPKKTREVIKASRTNGIGNESVTKLLGAMYQNINVYNDYLPVFDKSFVSPLHDNADYYYNFKLADTQYLGNKRLIHFFFTPKYKGQNTFSGDAWVNDTCFAIQKITLRLAEDANINFIEGLTLIQEYKWLNNELWFLSKDKFVVEIAPLGNAKTGFKGRKTTTYRYIQINSNLDSIINKNVKPEEVIVIKDAELKTDDFWKESRHENLTTQEKAIYQMIDSIQKHPKFLKYTNNINFLVTGYKNIGNYQIGPWFNWISANAWEGTRLRFDLGTNYKFNKKINLSGYVAYGFNDRQFKGKADIFYLPNKTPRLYFNLTFTKDLDNGQSYYDEISTDNIFTLAFRKPNIPIKNMMVEEQKIAIFKEFHSGFSILISANHKRFEPLRNLPDKTFFATTINEPLNNFETSIRFRYAYLERFLENNFYRSSLGSDYPIVELKLSKGWPIQFLNSSYSYTKVNFKISDYAKLPPNGMLYWNVFAGKVWSSNSLPFTILEVHPGNEIYYYNKYAFNLMNRFEFISDRYAGFNVEHNIGNGMFRWIGLTRKLKFRQFWSIKGLLGNLSEANQQMNFVGNHAFQRLNNKIYIEVGTGVDNIFKVLRLDLVWRAAPTPLPTIRQQRFGIFGSFRFSF